MRPKRIEYEVGSTIHGQPLTLVRLDEHGRSSWSLIRHPADQRDDQDQIHGLSSETIRLMAEAAKQHP